MRDQREKQQLAGFALTELLVSFVLGMIIFSLLGTMILFADRMTDLQQREREYQLMAEAVEGMLKQQMEFSQAVFIGTNPEFDIDVNEFVWTTDGKLLFNNNPVCYSDEILFFINIDRQLQDGYTYTLTLTNKQRNILYQKSTLIYFMNLRRNGISVLYGSEDIDSSVQSVIWYYQ